MLPVRSDRNIFELQPLEKRRFLTLTVANVTGGVLNLTGSGSAESITVNKSGSNIVVTDVTGATTVTRTFSAASVTSINIAMAGANDTVLITNNVRFANNVGVPATIAGGTGNDTLTSGPGADVLSGNDGNDMMDGGVGNDLMTGGANFDTSNYSTRTGALLITMGSGANDGEVAIGEADDVQTEEVFGGSGNDTITGGLLADYIAGGAGADSIRGGAGNDQLIGSTGQDKLFGEANDDFLLAQNADMDTVNGGTGPANPDLDMASIDPVDVAGRSLAAVAGPPSGLDSTYGTGGKVADGTFGTTPTAFAIDKEGRVIVAGEYTGGGYQSDFLIRRYDLDGNPDTTFGNGGDVLVDFTTEAGTGYGSNDDAPAAVAVAADGGIFVVGTTTDSNGDSDLAIVKLDDNGALVTGYDSDGLQAIDLTGRVGSGYASDDFAITAALESSGKLVIAADYSIGSTESGGTALVRLTTGGAFDGGGASDLDFNTDGVAEVGGLLDTVNGIGFLSFDGGLSEFILLAGQKNFSAAIARFNPIGNPDTSFGNDPAGVRIEALGVESTYQAVTVDADNNIIAVGSASQFSISRSAAALAAQPPADGNFAVIAKYDSIANDDPAVTYLAASQEFDAASFNDVTVDGAGRIVAAGQDSGDFLVARFNAALALDTSFSATGRTNTDFDFGGDTGRVVSIMTDGRIVVAGESNATSEATIPVSARYNGSPSVIVPPNSEGEVSEVELFIDYDTLQNPNAQPPLRGYLDNSSGPARLYTLSQPGDDGVARIHLNNDNNNVNIYNVIAGDGSANVAVNVDGLVIYYDVDTTTRIEILTAGGQDVVTTADNVLIPLLIDGGSGNDQLAGGGADDLIFAGPGNDTATGNSGNDIVIGGDGNDSVQGGAGNNLVIGGKGADQLSGAAGNDIVIAGYTSHDNNIAPLQAILNEWNAGGSVATRANNIRNGLGAANGNKLRVSNGPTVFDDGEKDFLSGASSNDWFFYKKSGDVVNGPSNSVLTDLL